MRYEIERFPIDGKPVTCEEIRRGHVNATYLITTDTGARYILQDVNTYAFPKTYIIMLTLTMRKTIKDGSLIWQVWIKAFPF